jgi:hypothetical protein
MAGIQDFIQLAAGKLDLGEDVARSATGGLLDFAQKKVPASEFQNLMKELPGAEGLLGGSAGSAGGGGLLGGVAKLAGGALGGKLGTTAGLVAALTGSGLDASKVAGFASEFVSFAKANVSPDLLRRILDAVPDLKRAAG